MRRHWLPACMSEEVAEPDGTPVRSRLLGEDLVVFRDTNGSLGVLGEYCPHRRASLAFGRNEECGLRCLYHGWKFDVDGNVLDMPSEPPGAAQRLGKKTKAYPVREGGGFVWAWMGRRDDEMRASSSRRPGRRCPASSTRSSRCTPRATGRRCSKARSIRRTARACIRPTCPRPRSSTAPPPPMSAWPRPSNDKAPRLQFEPPTMAFATRRFASRSGIAETAPVRAHDAVPCAVHRAHSAEQPVQPGADAGANRRREHHVLLDRLAPRPGEGHRAGGMAALLCRRQSGSIWIATTGRNATWPTTTCRTARR